MWIPISNNRWSPSTYVGGRVAVQAPEVVPYLRSVRGFWQKHGWLRLVSVPVGDGRARGEPLQDRPAAGEGTHACFAGGHVIVTGRPTAQNRFLWNGGKDDVDAWVVLASRYYGEYTNPSLAPRHLPRDAKPEADQRRAAARQADLDLHVRRRLSLDAGLHGDRAGLDPRRLRRLGGVRGHHRPPLRTGDDDVRKGNPLVSNDKEKGSFVLVYPGKNGPIAERPARGAARGDRGLGDPERRPPQARRGGGARSPLRSLLDHVRRARSSAARSAARSKTTTKYSWPTWSRRREHARGGRAMRAAALQAAASYSSSSSRREAWAGAVGSSSWRK